MSEPISNASFTVRESRSTGPVSPSRTNPADRTALKDAVAGINKARIDVNGDGAADFFELQEGKKGLLLSARLGGQQRQSIIHVPAEWAMTDIGWRPAKTGNFGTLILSASYFTGEALEFRSWEIRFQKPTRENLFTAESPATAPKTAENESMNQESWKYWKLVWGYGPKY